MKRSMLILTVFMITSDFVNGQNPFISCVINFEENFCWEASYYAVTLPSPGNTWQICNPQKTVFDSAYSSPKAILTDSTGPYPVNDTSGFIVKFLPYPGCMCAPVIGAHYKLDSDSLKDFGLIEFSLDHGETWLNALSDTVIPDPYWLTPRPVLTGKIHEWTEFLAFIPEFITNDTIYYRFTFISDSIQTNQDGWMLDDLALTEHTEGIGDAGSRNGITVYPNPADDMITLSVNTFMEAAEVSVYDIRGQICLQKTIRTKKEEISISGLGQGIYLVKIRSRNTCSIGRFIK